MIYIDNDYFSEPVLLRSISSIREEMAHIESLLAMAGAKLCELNGAREEMEGMICVTGEGEMSQALSDIVERADDLRLQTEALCERLCELREELSDTLWYMRGDSV